MTNPNEEVFESHICDWLVAHGGYLTTKHDRAADSHDFDADLGLDTAELQAFIDATQPDQWANLVTRHVGWPTRPSSPGRRRAREAHRRALGNPRHR